MVLTGYVLPGPPRKFRLLVVWVTAANAGAIDNPNIATAKAEKRQNDISVLRFSSKAGCSQVVRARNTDISIGAIVSPSVYKIDSLVHTEVEMVEVSKRSIFVGCMKLKDAFLHARQLDDLTAPRLQPFGEASGGRVTYGGGMKFDEVDLTMVCDVQEDRRSGGSLRARRS